MKLPDKSTGNLGTSASICGCAEVNDEMLCNEGGIVIDYLVTFSKIDCSKRHLN